LLVFAHCLSHTCFTGTPPLARYLIVDSQLLDCRLRLTSKYTTFESTLMNLHRFHFRAVFASVRDLQLLLYAAHLARQYFTIFSNALLLLLTPADVSR
jgi:hypothetical protein